MEMRMQMAAHRSCLSRVTFAAASLLLLLLLLLEQPTLAIRIEPTSSQGLNSTAAPAAYRVSRPEPKQPVQRVPPHLQDIRPGYVDDDAGDVIRIIEPPQHFQQLKRRRQRQPPAPGVTIAPPKAIVWEQPRKLSINRGAAVRPGPRPSPGGDLLTQETQLAAQYANNLQLPMEILASVRKTERLLQRQRQHVKQSPQQLQPLLRQRHIQRQTHTLIAQKSLEQQRFQRGQQQRLRAALLQEHKRSKRVKRQAAAGASSSSYDVPHGLKLVAHIGELLKNATRLVPDEPESHELAPTTATATATPANGNATNCDSRRRRQRLFRKTAARARNFRHEATTTAAAASAATTTKQAAAAAAAAAAKAKPSSEPTSSVTTSATPLASRLVNSRRPPNNRNQKQLAQPPRVSDSVLYADVMSTINNLRHEHEHEHELTAAPRFVAAEQVRNNTDYRALDVYLKQLDEISRQLPTVAPITALNQHELAPATPTPSWYLINSEGLIYETRLNAETKPTSALFHLFPDMPKTNKEPVTTLDLE